MQAVNLNRVHFIGIAGSGMAAIALVAHSRGITVSGSDLKASRYVQALLDAGVNVSFGHDARVMDDPTIELVVVSTAIPDDNPELLAARTRGVTVWHRAQMLAWLSSDRELLAVSGTHGKTTTSSMLACVLMELGCDPTFVVGGVVCSVEASAKAGAGDYFVVEADESDSSFVYLDPALAIITNIECDHLDHFTGLDEVKAAFWAFLSKLRPNGVAVVCADDDELVALARKSGHRMVTYGLSEKADVRLLPHFSNPHYKKDGGKNTDSLFTVRFADGQEVTLSLVSPGLHNMLNATAVLAALDSLCLDRAACAAALTTFKGVHRRFDLVGQVSGIAVVDDYGHHPTEVAATIAAAWQAGYSRVHILFQPHRYSRTRALLAEFATAFDAATTLTLMPIYSAGESAVDGVSSDALLAAIYKHNPTLEACLLSDRAAILARLIAVAQKGDVIICLGAGDVTLEAPQVIAALEVKYGSL